MSMDRCKQCDRAVDTDYADNFYTEDEDGPEGTCDSCRDSNWRERQRAESPLADKYPSPKINGSTAWHDSGHGAGDFL